MESPDDDDGPPPRVAPPPTPDVDAIRPLRRYATDGGRDATDDASDGTADGDDDPDPDDTGGFVFGGAVDRDDGRDASAPVDQSPSSDDSSAATTTGDDTPAESPIVEAEGDDLAPDRPAGAARAGDDRIDAGSPIVEAEAAGGDRGPFGAAAAGTTTDTTTPGGDSEGSTSGYLSGSPRLRSILVALGLATLALGVGFGLVLGTVFGLDAVGVTISPTVQIVASLLLFQGVTMGGVAIAYLRYRGLGLDYVGLSTQQLFGDPIRDALAVVVAFVIAFGAAFGGAILVSTLGVEAGTNQAADLAFEDPEILLLLIPGAFLLIGPGEELLFRGVIQGRLRESIGRWPAVTAAAVLFAVVHVTALSGGAGARLVSVTLLFFPSLVFGVVYELTDNLAVPALVHGAYDALLFTLLYVAIKFAGLTSDAVQTQAQLGVVPIP
jgi:hypothetical protein